MFVRTLPPFAIAVLLSLAAAAAGKPPNVVLIMADDLGVECLGSYGGTSYETPNLDALAESGTRFTHCYSTPKCVPSRINILTGRYGFRTGQQSSPFHCPHAFLSGK
ncbi:MAG: sulfatase-like hydrolase/transferase [Planctomycetota bacterium]